MDDDDDDQDEDNDDGSGGGGGDGSSSSIEFVHRAGLVRAVFSEPVDLLSRAHGWGMQL